MTSNDYVLVNRVQLYWKWLWRLTGSDKDKEKKKRKVKKKTSLLEVKEPL